MKTKPILPIVIIVAVALLVGIPHIQGAFQKKQNISAQRIGDRELFVGDHAKRLAEAKSYNHQDTIRAIDGAWGSITLGDTYSKGGQYERAANAYEKAYSLDRGSRAVSGFLLAQTYEKLGRYDDATAQLNQMIQNKELNKHGIQDAKEMVARLLATKQQSAQQNN